MRTPSALPLPIIAVAMLAGSAVAEAGQRSAREIGVPTPARSGLAPSVMLNDVGFDTNILSSADPRSDLTATLRGQIEPSGQIGPVVFRGKGGIDLAYFQQNATQRSVNGDGALTIELRSNRLVFHASGAALRTRESYPPEIDVPVRRSEVGIEGGATFRVTGKTSINGTVGWAQLAFDEGDQPFEWNLHETLDRTEDTLSIGARTAVTPLTTIVARADVQRDRFPLCPQRDTNDARIVGGVEFRPTALVGGKAHIGYRQLIARDPAQPSVSGVVASVDLTYTLLDAVRFGALLERDLGHSYSENARYFAFTGLRFSVTRRVTRAWDLTAMVSRGWLVYPGIAGPSAGVDAEDQLLRYGGIVEYRLADTTIGLTAEYGQRRSGIGTYGYDRLRVVSSIAHRF